MQSMKTLKEADPHDVFAIETILAARGDRAPPLAHDAVGHPGGPQGAPEISIGVPAAQIEPAFHAAGVSDIPIENIRPDEIKIDGRPTDAESTLTRLVEVTECLSKNVESTPRQVVSAAVIDNANVLLELVRIMRGFYISR